MEGSKSLSADVGGMAKIAGVFISSCDMRFCVNKFCFSRCIFAVYFWRLILNLSSSNVLRHLMT